MVHNPRESRMSDDSAKAQTLKFPNPVGRSAFARYAVAIGVAVFAWAMREGLTPLWGRTELPFIFFFPAIVFAAWYGRRGPALLAIVLSTLLAGGF
jgi:K+-sensing histidine kinase KdpD